MRTDVGKAVYYILANDATVAGIVGTKIFPVRAVQLTSVPYVTYSIISTNPADTKQRPSYVDTVRLQIDCYETTYAKAETLHHAVRTALDAYTIGATVATVKLDGIKYETENDTIDEDVDLYRKSADYMIRVKY